MIGALRRDRVFVVSALVSLLFHLSMITVFRIVIYFPRYDIEYFDVSIVETTSEFRRALDENEGRLRVPSAERALERLENEAAARDARWGDLPSIELPTVAFAELDRLRLRTQALETRSRYRKFFAGKRGDTWSRFGRQLGSLGGALGRLAGNTQDDADRLVPISRPAPGFEAYLEWMSEPYDRQPLSVSRIEALWGLEPSLLTDPLTLIFRVDPAGAVVEVLAPVDDEEGVVDSAAMALSQYRFEPLSKDHSTIQLGTLLIRAAE